MNEQRINTNLQKANSFLHDAHLLFINARYDSCVSRAYYAMYRAAIALMECFGYIRPSWNHGRLVTALEQRLVRERELLNQTSVAELRSAYQLRTVADYSNDSVSVVDAQTLLTLAEQFVVAFQEVIKNEID